MVDGLDRIRPSARERARVGSNEVSCTAAARRRSRIAGGDLVEKILIYSCGRISVESRVGKRIARARGVPHRKVVLHHISGGRDIGNPVRQNIGQSPVWDLDVKRKRKGPGKSGQNSARGLALPMKLE